MSQTSSTKETKEIKVVLTKTHDGGSFGKHLKSYTSGENSFDAFLHYSDQETRMRALLFHRDNRNEETGRHNIAPCRETRISYELHPSVLMDVDPIWLLTHR